VFRRITQPLVQRPIVLARAWPGRFYSLATGLIYIPNMCMVVNNGSGGKEALYNFAGTCYLPRSLFGKFQPDGVSVRQSRVSIPSAYRAEGDHGVEPK